MENYSHFIITRFNLNLYAQDKHDLPTRTDRWLEHRFEVFERYCLPSVAAQTSGNFTWLCLFDAATPESCRRRIEGYKARCPQFEAVYYTAAQAANLTENLRTTIAAYVSCDRKGRKSPPPKLLITTNLDNDDAFSPMSSNCCNASCVPLPANGFTACCTVTSISPTAASRSKCAIRTTIS